MAEPTVITKVLVGSRLHGLHNEKSDYDYRGIFMHDLRDVLSPFKNLKTTSWIEGDVDNTSYELAQFCKDATHGNATILEVFFSNEVIETSPIAEEMRRNWQKFIDTDRVVMASRGYASNQYNKMQLFEDIGVKDQRRTSKFAIAYCRVLWQCAEFLRTGTFPCQITEPALKAFLLEVKSGWKDEYIPHLTELFMQLQKEVSDAWKTAPKMTPDIKWIEEFIYDAYTRNHT
jgi:predicted nucleotidyltransferase